MKELKVTMQQTMAHEYIAAEEIPEIELYVDQIVTLLENNLGGLRRTEGEKLLTKTMVNNYSKDGLLKRIKGKKYSKEHVLMILLIVGLKRGLSVQDIGRLLSGEEDRLSSAGGYAPEAVKELYSAYGKTGEAVSRTLPSYVEELLQTLGAGFGKDDPLPAILLLSEISALCSRTAQALIDESFPEKKK